MGVLLFLSWKVEELDIGDPMSIMKTGKSPCAKMLVTVISLIITVKKNTFFNASIKIIFKFD